MPSAKASRGVVIRFGHPALEQIDPSTSFLYAPHTVSALLVGGSAGAEADTLSIEPGIMRHTVGIFRSLGFKR